MWSATHQVVRLKTPRSRCSLYEVELLSCILQGSARIPVTLRRQKDAHVWCKIPNPVRKFAPDLQWS